MHHHPFLLAVTAALLPVQGLLAADAARPASFDEVRAVFKKRCTTCHNQDRARGDLDLSTIDGVNAGSSSGPVVIAGKPDDSLVYTLAAHQEDPKMPPGAPRIPQRELDLIRDWIAHGISAGEAAPAARPKLMLAATPRGAELPARPQGLEPVKPWLRSAAVTGLAASPKANLVAVAGLNQILLFEDLARPAIGALPYPEGKAFCLKFVRGGEVLLAGGGVGAESGKVVAFDIVTRQRLFTVGKETDVVLAADLSPDGSLVATGGPGKTVNIYRTSDGELVTSLTKHTDWILALAFSPDGLLLASSDRFGGVQVWESKTAKVFDTLRGHTGPVNAVWWTNGSEELATAGDDGTIQLWNMHDGSSKSVLNAGIGPVLCTISDSQGRTLLGGRQKAFALFDHSTASITKIPFDDEVVELALTAQGAKAIVAGASGATQVIDLADPARRTPLLLPIAPAVTNKAPIRRSQLKQAEVAAAPAMASDASPAATTTLPAPASTAVSDRLAEARQAAALADAAVKATEAALATQKAVAEHLRADLQRLESAAPSRVAQP